ncbi:Ste13p KNAG_0J01500 [Huiozyma naganishii CBS 8797]|uniref:Dipeptidyl aminopeptidase A n=1 Tax=Huiozyma naganishii (strain ATCC MYA-139 / BCRC 22969 / CBS 8797 / KCTC 17520 / NBRC 10181 / NCYC 3082 / Yp74L-3) TaxID=1071383 RepID=J7SAJ7_HUIN7|nr:hypothetical protein KNAG_0J01500 [Kazachstania naganishii CBS 8797]CCK72231.1 hypothetical protein KNAG_0J01500 [Kazachstania naganishii CBS 8797]
MSKPFSKGHKRKNSQHFLQQQQQTSSSFVHQGDLDVMDNLEMEDIPPPLNNRGSPVHQIPVDLENQSIGISGDSEPLDENLLTTTAHDNMSWDSWYLNKKFGYNNRRVIVLLLGAVAFVFLIFLAPTLFTNSSTETGSNGGGGKGNGNGRPANLRRFNIKDVLSGSFDVKHSTFHFIDPPQMLQKYDMDPGLYYTTRQNGDGSVDFIAKQLYDAEYSKNLGGNKFSYRGEEYLVEKVRISHRLDKIIFGTNIQPGFRHSSKGYYWIKDVDSQEIIPITPFRGSTEPEAISFVHFSPNYNFIYFVYENNIYLQPVNHNVAPMSLTTDGSGAVRNGKPDWIYEEEVLASESAVWWAPDDSKVIFAKFNDTNVPLYTFPQFTDGQQYTPFDHIYYPKPGTRNPQVTLYLFNALDGTIYAINTMTSQDDEFILYDVQWISSKLVLIKDTDRYSKVLRVKLYDISKGEMTVVREVDTNKFNGWVEKPKKMLPIPPNEVMGRKEYGYVDIHEDANGYNHLFYYETVTSQKGRQLTYGQWEITNPGIVGFAYEEDWVYFVGNRISPMGQHLYTVALDGNYGPDSLKQLQDPNSVDDFFSFELSSSGRYAMMKQLGPGAPKYSAGSLSQVLSSINNPPDEGVIALTDSSKFEEASQKFDLPVTSYKSMYLSDGVKIDYVEIKPSNIDPRKKYPLLVNVYGGPGSQTFTKKTSISFEQSVVSGLNAIVLQIEPRGTGGKGWKFRSWAKEKLGYWEPRDITEVTQRFIKENKMYVDEEHVAIWGWSYGGFSTLKTVEFDTGNTFKYAVAVAPVTNWMYYDSIYTERYMGPIGTNIDGYNSISVVNDTGAFKKLNRFMLMHGTSDDNVHIQNTFEFVDKLVSSGIKNYDMQIFPDSDHSISFHGAQKLVFERIYNWLGDAFSGAF